MGHPQGLVVVGIKTWQGIAMSAEVVYGALQWGSNLDAVPQTAPRSPSAQSSGSQKYKIERFTNR